MRHTRSLAVDSDQIHSSVRIANKSINRVVWHGDEKRREVSPSNKKAQRVAHAQSVVPARCLLVNCKLAASPRFSNLQGFAGGPNKSSRAESNYSSYIAGCKERIHIIRLLREERTERETQSICRARGGRSKSPARVSAPLFFTHTLAPRLTPNHFSLLIRSHATWCAEILQTQHGLIALCNVITALTPFFPIAAGARGVNRKLSSRVLKWDAMSIHLDSL